MKSKNQFNIYQVLSIIIRSKIFIFIVIVIFFSIFDFNFICSRYSYYSCKQFYKEYITGKVIDKYYDRNNKTEYTLKILYKDSIIKLNRFCYNLHDPAVFKISDSIVKPANSFDYYIYRKSNKDSLIVLEGYKDCDEYMDSRNARWRLFDFSKR